MADGKTDTKAGAQDQDRPFLIGIASSAGGLEAITALVRALPDRSGASYVIAQHMSAQHTSMFAVLIGRETALPVRDLAEDIEPQADTIYVTPPGRDVTYANGKLCLSEPTGRPGSPKPSADRLFYSMAEQLGDHCVAIVLSGTGTDGSYGVQAVREAGGITIAQDQASARYDGMPTSAVESGCIDLVLSPEQIGQHLSRILSSPDEISILQTLPDESFEYTELLQILLARSQVDFREYKSNTVHRRVQRRMLALEIPEYEDYVTHCRQSAEEVDALFRDLLISVTRFFRDPAQFERLGIELRALLENRPQDEGVRVWVAGCATGEEAYSVAILIAEAMGGPDQVSPHNVQIFATDIDDNALKIGRRGIYPASAADDIPPNLLDRYFDRTETRIAVKPALKQLILFSHHNVFQDPPFINLDLVTLRNLLIYFRPRLQERVLNRVQYALRPRGLLFLGSSESLGPIQVDYEVVSDRNRLFRKRSLVRKGLATRIGEFNAGRHWPVAQRPSRPKQPETSIHKEMFEALARSVGPNSVLVSGTQDIIRVFGDISPFIQLHEDSRLDLSLALLKSPMREEAASLCSVAQKRRERRRGGRHVFPHGEMSHVYLEAFPIRLPNESENYTLLAIQSLLIDKEEDTPEDAYAPEAFNLRQLEADVASTREALQQTIEELQTSNEEQQSLNEELQSANEDLQATNEELETSNEELQSSNEELLTVNEELQISTAELDGVRRDLESVLQSAPLAILVVDNALQITRASVTARRLFRISDGVERMHLSQCEVPPGYPSLGKIASDTFQSRQMQQSYFTTDRAIVALKALPYFSETRDIRGITIVISEVETEELTAKMAMVEELEDVGHFRLDLKTNILTWSDEVFRIHGLPVSDTPPSLDTALDFYPPADRKQVETSMEYTLRTGRPYAFRLRINRADGLIRYVEARGKALFDLENKPSAIIGVFRDIHDDLQTRFLLEQFERAEAERGIGFYSFDVLNDASYWSQNLFSLLGYDAKDGQPPARAALSAFAPDDQDKLRTLMETAVSEGTGFVFDGHLGTGDTARRCRLTGDVRRESGGEVTHVFGLVIVYAS